MKKASDTRAWASIPAEEQAELTEQARAMLRNQVPLAQIGKRLRIPYDNVKRITDPHYAAHRAALTRAARAQRGNEDHKSPIDRRGQGERNVDKADIAARLAMVPDDTRSLSGQLLGDPLPGRSALDKKRAAQ